MGRGAVRRRARLESRRAAERVPAPWETTSASSAEVYGYKRELQVKYSKASGNARWRAVHARGRVPLARTIGAPCCTVGCSAGRSARGPPRRFTGGAVSALASCTRARLAGTPGPLRRDGGDAAIAGDVLWSDPAPADVPCGNVPNDLGIGTMFGRGRHSAFLRRLSLVGRSPKGRHARTARAWTTPARVSPWTTTSRTWESCARCSARRTTRSSSFSDFGHALRYVRAVLLAASWADRRLLTAERARSKPSPTTIVCGGSPMAGCAVSSRARRAPRCRGRGRLLIQGPPRLRRRRVRRRRRLRNDGG